MSMVRCCDCNKPMDTDEPGSIYGDSFDSLYCLGCYDKLEECGMCDGAGEECESRGVWQKCGACNGSGKVLAEP